MTNEELLQKMSKLLDVENKRLCKENTMKEEIIVTLRAEVTVETLLEEIKTLIHEKPKGERRRDP